ncbi:MAG: M56 family metallopeptidase [Oscillospiraceae bacterium]|nr:M56 family metallopeptidase [Oscillospiraceae bacterium]
MFFYTFLPKLLNMSLTAGVVIVVVLLLRLPLRRAPKIISYALWGVVLFRLLCPVSLTSAVSLFSLLDAPAADSGALLSRIEYVPDNIVHTEYPAVALPVPALGEAVSAALPQGEEQLAADPLAAPMTIATYLWLAGVTAMAVYAAVSYIRLRRALTAASPLRDNIYLTDGIASAFVLGLFRPRIYLPSSLDAREQPYIIAHERCHIRRGDHIIKALAFAALCVHWFNPLVWLAFILSVRDMEMSCDEAVIRKWVQAFSPTTPRRC